MSVVGRKDRPITRLRAAGALVVLATTLRAADDRAAERPDAVVFLGAPMRGEPAPSQTALADLVVLSEVPEKDPWFRAVTALGDTVKEVVPFRPGKLADAFRRLQQLRPGFVIVLIRPASLDVNFHFEFLERASRLDDDPFVDFAFGYLTGATPDEAVEFATAIAAARKAGVPRSIVEFGPSSAPHAVTPPGPHPWAAGFETRRLAHPEKDATVAAALKSLAGAGVFHAWGHGSPDRVSDGLTGAQIRESGLDLFPALYFSGPCWCGTTARWFDGAKGAIAANEVAPKDSFLLALLKARATGVFAGLDPDRGETSEHELEELLVAGGPLGMAAKSTYDDAVLAYRREELALPRYEPGHGRPFRDIHDEMIAGAACRALFGDPTWAPFASAGPEFFRVETARTKEGLVATWRGDGDLGQRWAPVDVLRAGGGWTHRVRLRFDLPRDEAAKLRTCQVQAMTKDGKPLSYVYPTAALESWGDRVRVHAMLVFPRNDEYPALSGAKSLEAKLLFRE